MIVIEKSHHTPRPDKLSKFTSRSFPEERLAASAQPPSNKFGLRIESNVAVPLFFHERKRKLASGSAEAAQCSYQRGDDVCREIHQQTFGDPECAFSRIESTADQRFSIETGGTQVNCDEMHSFNSDFGTSAHFVTLRSRMIDLPK